MSSSQYFNVEQVDGVMVISPRCSGGAFAEEASRAVWQDLFGQVADADANVVVDFGGLNFFGSTMLDFLATLKKRLAAKRKLALASVSKTGVEVLQISRFDQFLDVFPTVDDAVTTLKAS